MVVIASQRLGQALHVICTMFKRPIMELHISMEWVFFFHYLSLQLVASINQSKHCSKTVREWGLYMMAEYLCENTDEITCIDASRYKDPIFYVQLCAIFECMQHFL